MSNNHVNVELPINVRLDEKYYPTTATNMNNVLRIIAQNTLSNMTYTLPSSNNVGLLTNDGTGNLAWVPISGIGGDTITVTNAVTDGILKLLQYGTGDSSIRLYTPTSTFIVGNNQLTDSFRLFKNGSGLSYLLSINDDTSSINRTSADSSASLSLNQFGTGDSSIYLGIPGDGYTIGVDASDSNKFKISHSNALGTNDIFTLTSSGSISSLKSISLPQTATDGSEGLINIGTLRMAHFNALHNIFMGESSGVLTATGGNNIGLGCQTLSGLSTGTHNLCVGYTAGQAISSGDDNTLLGYAAGNIINVGFRNTCVGSGANLSAAGLSNATALGYGAIVNESNKMQFGAGIAKFAFDTTIFTLDELTKLQNFYVSTPNLNYYVGSGNRLAVGSGNVIVGNTGAFLSSGNANTLVGLDAGRDVATGSSNTMVGLNAGNTTQSGSSNTCVGHNTSVGVAAMRRTAIGYGAVSPADDCLILGDTNVKVGIRTVAPLTEALTVIGNADITGNIVISGNVDGVNISALKADYDANINQNVQIGENPNFANLTNMNMTGWVSWTGVGAYYSLVGTTFTLLRGGSGYIKSILRPVTAPQSVTISANATEYIYVTPAGGLAHTTTPTDTLYKDNLVLFSVLYDGTSSIVKKENHPYEFDTPISDFFHNTLGTIVRGVGANLTPVTVPPGDGSLLAHDQVKIVASDTYEEHGLSTTISDISPVKIQYWYQSSVAGPTMGKWYRYLPAGPPGDPVGETQVPLVYNQAGVGITAVTAGNYGVMRVYVTGSDLNSVNPRYVGIIDTSEYASNILAETAITNGTCAIPTSELKAIEFAQLGYIVFRNSGVNGYVYETVIEKDTFNSRTVGGGSAGSHVLLSDINGGTFQDGGHTYLAQIHSEGRVPNNNDDIDNYKNTAIWLDTTLANKDIYICVDNANTSAIWKQIAWANLNEVRIGYNSVASNYGVAIGTGAIALNDSVVIGRGAATSTTTGLENVYIGHDSGTTNTSGSQNVGIGVHAANSISTGSGNTILGADSDGAAAVNYQTAIGQNATTGAVGAISMGSWAAATNQYSIAIGSGIAGVGTAPVTTGNYAIAIGQNIKAQATGAIGLGQGSILLNGDTALGYNTMMHTTHAAGNEGYYNTAVGMYSMLRLSSGYQNTSLGMNALMGHLSDAARLITGYQNTVIGADSMINVACPVSGVDSVGNTVVGFNSLPICHSGDYNVAVGHNSGASIQTGSNNIFIGASSNGIDATDNQIAIGSSAACGAAGTICLGSSSTASGVGDISIGNSADTGTGGNSIVMGYLAGNSAALGDSNTIIGSNAATKIVRSIRNVCLGAYAGGNLVGDPALLTKGHNICIGYESMYRFDTPINATTAEHNIAMGNQTMWNTTTGSFNISMGYLASTALISGVNNICIGKQVCSNMDTGTDNVVLGTGGAPSLTSGTHNICIGTGADCDAASTNQIAIGKYAAAYVSNTIAIGNGASTSGTNAIAIGNGTTAPQDCIALGNTSSFLSIGGYNTRIVSKVMLQTSNTTDNITELCAFTAAGTTNCSTLNFLRSRGTLGVNTITNDGDRLGYIGFFGVGNDLGWRRGASIITLQNGTVTGTAVPADMVFGTSPGSSIDSTERMRITKDGVVSVGGWPTGTSPSTNFQVLRLAVNDVPFISYSTTTTHTSNLAMRKSNSNTLGTMATTQDGAYLGILSMGGVNAAGSPVFCNGAGIITIQNGTAGSNSVPADMIFLTSPGGASDWVERMRLNKDGKLTIGTSTLYDTTSKFQVSSSGTYNIPTFITCSATAAHYSALFLAKTATDTEGAYTATSNGHYLGELRFCGSTGGAPGSLTAATSIMCQQTGANNGTQSPAKMWFSTSDGTASYERFTIASDGNISIGLGQSYKYIRQSVGNTYAYLWTNYSNPVAGLNGDYYNISVNYDGVNNVVNNAGGPTTALRIGYDTLRFQTGAINTAPTQARFNIASSGHCTIYGPGNTGYTVADTSGNEKLTLAYALGAGNYVLFSSAGDVTLRGSSGPISIGYAASYNGIRITNAGQYWFGVTAGVGNSTLKFNWTTALVTYDTSSAKYKENINTYTDDPFGIIDKLTPKTFYYKPAYDSTNHTLQLGLIAEDVDLVDKQYVGYNKENLPESVNYDRLTVPLISATQQLNSRVKTLELENKQLKDTQNQLLNTIATLETQIQQLQDTLKIVLERLPPMVLP